MSYMSLPMACAIALTALATSSNAQVPIPGFGALEPKAAENTGEVLLALPPELNYNVLIRAGDTMSDGKTSPGLADGMAAFSNGNLVRLIRNHENGEGDLLTDNVAFAYDPIGGGGTTTLDFDPATRLLVNSFVSLHGTVRNCAGGPTPWGSWITCEESNFWNDTMDIQHGYMFEVPASSDSLVDAGAARLSALGLVYPEAIAVDPQSGVVYITMDQGPGGFFRFVPDTFGDLSSGQLQMLAIEGLPGVDANAFQVGTVMNVEWVDINTGGDEVAYRLDRRNAYNEGLGQGGTTFDRPEGIWAGRGGAIYMVCTDDGPIDKGQIYELRLRPNDVQTLELIYTTVDEAILDSPDNVCVTPRNNNLILCEDGSNREYLHFLSRKANSDNNRVFRLALNLVPGFESSEWAGACFSPDGKTLFANVQSPLMTFAIWPENGDWGPINR